MSVVIQFMLKKSPRPTILAKVNGVSASCLIDTGAEIPVWLGTENKILERFPDALLINDSIVIKGFGGNGTKYKVYKVPCLTIDNGDGYAIHFHNCIVAVAAMNKVKFQFIISATMLQKTCYYVDNVNHKLTVECNRNDYYMIFAEGGKSVSVFEQESNLRRLFSGAQGNK